MSQTITLKTIEKPKEKDTIQDIDWMCDSFGLVTGRDTENTSARIFSDLLSKLSHGITVSSDLLADDLRISHARVNHHLRNLAGTGIVYREHRFIFLRGGTLKSAVEELRKDAIRIFDELECIAEEIDNSIGLKNRT